MQTNMEYLQWGKDGCDKCAALPYYCDECTLKIVEFVNKECQPTPVAGELEELKQKERQV